MVNAARLYVIHRASSQEMPELTLNESKDDKNVRTQTKYSIFVFVTFQKNTYVSFL